MSECDTKNIQLTAEAGALQIEASAHGKDGKGKKLPTFSAIAYTGRTMVLSGFESGVVVELAGITIPKQELPVRFEHDAKSGVGHTTKIAVVDGQLIAEGIISRDTPSAIEVVSSSRNGFPWGVSMGARVEASHFLQPGETEVVNGTIHTGPIEVITRSLLGEISFVDLGADINTGAAIAAQSNSKGDGQMPDNDKNNGAAQAERTRIQAINTITAAHSSESWAIATKDAGIDAGDSVDLYSTRLLAASNDARELGALRGGNLPGHERPNIQATSFNSADSACEDKDILAGAVLNLVGKSALAEKTYGERTAQASSDLGCRSFMDVLKASLRLSSIQPPTGTNEILRASFSTLSLPIALGSSMDTIAQDAFVNTPSTWRSWARPVDVNSLREHTLVRHSLSGETYAQVGPGGELKHESATEQSSTVTPLTRGRILTLTRTDIINDSISALTGLVSALSRQAAASLSTCIYDALKANAGSFFSAGAKNLLTSGSSVLSVDSLSSAIQLLRDRQSASGEPIDVRPGILLVPSALESTAKAILNSLELQRDTSSTDNLPSGNPHSASGLTLEIETRLATLNGGDDLSWYLLSRAEELSVMAVAFLDGQQSPTVETAQADFNTLGLSVRAFHDFGAALSTAEAGVKSDGA